MSCYVNSQLSPSLGGGHTGLQYMYFGKISSEGVTGQVTFPRLKRGDLIAIDSPLATSSQISGFNWIPLERSTGTLGWFNQFAIYCNSNSWLKVFYVSEVYGVSQLTTTSYSNVDTYIEVLSVNDFSMTIDTANYITAASGNLFEFLSTAEINEQGTKVIESSTNSSSNGVYIHYSTSATTDVKRASLEFIQSYPGTGTAAYVWAPYTLPNDYAESESNILTPDSFTTVGTLEVLQRL